MNLHIGSGSVYLKGWQNIDVPGPRTFLAKHRPDLVEKWGTTEDKYYAKHEDVTLDTLRAGPLDQEYVCDAFGSFDNIPAPYWEADEVLCRHSFEHLSISEARRALDQIDGLLKPGGILRLDVPDHEATLRLYKRTGDEFYIRHLLGPRRNEYGFHMMSYDRTRLRALVESQGFVFVEEEPDIHLYPSICLRFVKPGPRAPVDYVKLPYDIPKNWTVAEVGPGNYPLQRADVYIDKDIDKLKPLSDKGKSTVLGEIESGLPRIENKTFDYLWASHVMEHVQNPLAAAATISRIAKRGTMVVPSALKEGLFGGQEEMDHRWLVLPSPTDDGAPIFVKHNPGYMQRIKNAEIEKITGRLWRTGPNRIEEARYLRKFFYEHEADLDVIVHWESELKVRVIG